jgi:filamentous hemagglutinin family protein
MNSKIFKNVFSKRLGCLVAVGEHTSSQGKANGASASAGYSVLSYAAKLTAACVWVSLAWAGPAGSGALAVLPTVGQVAQGAANISQSGAVMNITQSTHKAVVNWNTFDIGTGAKVNIVQPGASAVMLNRVTSANPSQILGQLNANGQVVLVNPNGILFGKDGSVNANSFTASTLGITDTNFMAGNHQFERNGNTASVVNQGNIKTTGGYVALLGASVSNEGQIQTQGGTAYLAAAETIKIPVSGSDRIKLELSPSRINAAVSNAKGGTIVTEGGQVYMQAAALNSAVASILQSGDITTAGEQGGAVHLLADGGQIKVDGSITANTTGTGINGHVRKGGDIVIGRDDDSGVLAKTTDVKGAKLESQGGFVETSGDHLITAGVSIKAKDWLLDPTDINIVSAGTATPDTPSTSAGTTTTYQQTSGINTSEVLKSTIETAINNGTNVTITTANPTVGANGAGNITLSTALNFSNTGATDATLTLLAKNGITQNAGASVTTNSLTSTKLVNVVMTSEGLYGGADGASASSAGIRLNSTISTNGDVTLSGTTNNSGAASASNAIGVDTAAAAAITARNISITGSSQSSFGIQSVSTLSATGNITLNGTSKNWVGVVTNGAINATGALSITGTKTSASGYQGVNVASNLTGNSITINGTGVNWDAVQFNTGVTLNATTTLDVTGVSTSAKGVYFLGTNTFNAGRFLINATSTSGYGIHFSGTSTLNTASYDIKATTSAASTNALYFTGGTYTFNSTSTTTESLIEATRTATGSDSIFVYSGATLNLNSGSGKTSMATSATNVGGGIRLGFAGGSVVNTTGDVTIGSKNSANAYFMQQGTINALSGNLTLKAQAAADAFYMQDGGGTAARVVGTNGANITLDATSTGSGTSVNLNASTNAVNIISTGGVSGSGSAGSISITGVSATGSGIYKNAATITNTNGVITLNGTSSGGVGLGVLTGTGTISASGDLTITGLSTGNNGVYSTGALTSTGASVSVTGTSSTSSALSLQGDITGHQNVLLTGTNTAASNANATVYSNKTVTATNGTIAVTANTSGTTASALQLASGAALNTTNRAITLSTDSLNLDTTGGAGANINAGTNTVTLQNRSSGVLVNIGGSDVGNTTATSRTLGLTNAELNRITAGNLLIGNNTAGNLTVSSATTLATERGNIELVTGGNIVLSSNLETTGTSRSLTLSAASGSISGAGNITTDVGNTETITLNASAAGTLSGVISGGGSLVKQGAGTTTLTGANNYSGTTTISTGTLQVGSGGATGALGSGGIINNSALIFNRNATTDLSMANAISGTGSVEQAGAGKTILSTNNSYSGATSVSGGILQVGNGGSTGTLGTATSVTLSNNATLAFNKNVNTTIDKSIGGNGNVTANITGDLALASDIALTGTNTINLTASGSITRTASSIAATNLYMTATGGSIGSTTQRIQSNVSSLYLSSSGDQFVTEANGVTVSSRTTNNGNINLQTTNGTLTVGTANSVAGIIAHGSGNITLAGTSTTGIGVYVGSGVSTTTGDVSVTGTSSATTNFANPEAAVKSAATISGRDVTMVATVTSTSGNVLGYYGAGGGFTASGQLNLSGSTNNASNGFYSFTGALSSGTGMSISGTSASGQAVGFDNNVTLTNGNAGGISISGTATNSTQQAIGLRGVAISNNGGDVLLTGVNGIVYTDAGNAAWGNGVLTNTITNSGVGAVQVVAGNGSASNSGAINGSVLRITQNANAGVVVSTSGTGNVTSPKIINAGTGDIVVAAGSLIAAGTATGGQVLTVAGNTLTQTNGTPGKTYVYSGAPSTTGVLSNLSTGFNNLYYQGTSAALNAGFGQGFDSNHANDMTVPGGGSASGTQVFFRTATKPSFSMTLSNNNKSYGAADPAGFSSTSGATLINPVSGVGGNNTFAVTTADVLAGLTGGRVAGENVGSYAYSLSANSFNTTLTAQPNLVIGRRDITLATLAASNKVYDGSTLATITSGTFGNLANGETLLISGQGLFGTKDVANGKTVTVADVSTLTKANGTGNWSNYNLTTTSKTTTANITKATLTATARDDARFVTQADTANFAGVRFSGFKLGDTEAVVDTSGVTVTRTNAVNDTAAATYPGVLVPGGAAAVNYDFTYVNGNYTIVPARQLLVRTTSQSVVYGTSPTYATTAAYLDGNGVTINTLTRTGTNNNYTFNDGAGTSVTMTLKPYSGSTVATQSTSGNTTVGNYDVKDLVYTQTGTNFLGTPVFVGTLSVTPKEITPNATGVSKVYDATTSMANVVVGMTGKITNDRVNIGGTGAFSQSTVGTNLGYSVTGVSLSSTDAGNYYLTNGANSFSGTDGAITRAPLVATANSRTTTFNGGAQSVTGFTVAGLLGTDSVTDLVGISASGATGTNVGTYANTMTVANQTNYSVTGVNGALTIDPAPIVATDISGVLRGTLTKVYDGTTLATLTPANYTLTGWLGADGATVTKTLGTYNNANVGVGKTVTVNLSRSDYQASGSTDLSNYNLPSFVSGTIGVITPKNVSLSSFAVANKVYDGNNVANITAGTVLTGVGSETLSVTGTGIFADKNVGASKVVTANDVGSLIKIDGTGQWDNYNLISSNAASTASITPKLLQAVGWVADKVYDGTTQATVSTSTLSGTVTGDAVYLQAGNAFFADKNVSRGIDGHVIAKAVTVSNLTLKGSDAGNYALSLDSFNAQAKITPKVLDSQLLVNSKVYDANTLATVVDLSVKGSVSGEDVGLLGEAAQFADKNVSRDASGTVVAKAVTVSGLKLLGSDAKNYELSSTVAQTQAKIDPKVLDAQLQVSNKVYDADTLASVVDLSVKGTLSGEQVGVTGEAARFVDKNVSRDDSGAVVAKAVTVSGLKLLGADAKNYELSSRVAQTQAKIEAKVLDTHLQVNNKVYDANTLASVVNLSVKGAVSGEQVGVIGDAAQFADKNVSRDVNGAVVAKAVTVSGLKLLGANAKNYELSASVAQTQAKILPKVLGSMDTTVVDKTFDETLDAMIKMGSVQGLVGDERLTIIASGRFQSSTPELSKPVNVKFELQDGANGGRANNYSLPDQILLGNIFAKQSIVSPPVLEPVKTTPGGGVRFVPVTPNTPFAAAVGNDSIVIEAKACTVTDLEPCDCEKTALDGLDVCLVPRNTQASRGNERTFQNEATPSK